MYPVQLSSMNCFHLPVNPSPEVASQHSRFHEWLKETKNVPSGQLIRHCLSQISPDEPEKGIAAAKVIQCALREILQKERVKRSLAEYYGVNYLLTSLNHAIKAFETDGRVNELMFVTMRIGRELFTYQNDEWISAPPKRLM